MAEGTHEAAPEGLLFRIMTKAHQYLERRDRLLKTNSFLLSNDLKALLLVIQNDAASRLILDTIAEREDTSTRSICYVHTMYAEKPS